MGKGNTMGKNSFVRWVRILEKIPGRLCG